MNDDYYIEQEMEHYRKQALNKLSVVVPSNLVEPFGLSLLYGWQEDNLASKKLAQSLDLDPIDFICLAEDFDAFKSFYIRHVEAGIYA